MRKGTRDSRGFTLIAALLLTLLLSALAVGLLYMVSNQERMGGNDLEGNLAYYGAESGIEYLTAQLSLLYQTSQSPNAAAINALTSTSNPENFPTGVTGSNITNINYVENITWPPNQANGVACPNPPNPCGSWDIVGAGPDQGMVASLIPFTLQVTATRASTAGESTTNAALTTTGASVNLSRTVEVALLPAFEFGMFCDGDCDYFAGPNFNFGGRVHANGNLFLATGATLTFTDKIAAVSQVILDQLENGHSTAVGYGGVIYVPNAAGGCPSPPNPGPGSTPALCQSLTQGSWTGGFPPTGAANAAWKGISAGTPPSGFNDYIINGLTGATKLQLPFVQADNVGAVEIIRRPTPGDSALVSNSRLYNQANIRILLADTACDLHPERLPCPLDANDVQLLPGVGVAETAAAPGVAAGTMYYATANTALAGNSWVLPTGCGAGATWPLHGQVTVAGSLCQSAWLRVEYLNAAGTWVGVTNQWLGYGFGRSYNQAPTHPWNSSVATAPLCTTAAYGTAYPAGQCQNPLSPAILILQHLQNGLGAASATGAGTDDNWLPLNLYDAREGEPRDSRPVGDLETSCSPNGVMNVVELDVGNLWLWLQGAKGPAGSPYLAGSGQLVSQVDMAGVNNNGWILYFSDHRGMLKDKYPLTAFYNGFSGMSGLNDVVNSGSATGVPDQKLEPITYYATALPTPYSPEDPAIKGTAILGTNVDRWGENNLGAGFGIAAASMAQPYYISGTYAGIAACSTKAEWNMVTGPRHALRLVDGGMGTVNGVAAVSYLPQPAITNPVSSGNGFTVASEEPVYVYGDYNSGAADPVWAAGAAQSWTTPHSATAIIADSVTLLSNPPSAAAAPAATFVNCNGTTIHPGWTDHESFLYPGQAVCVGASGGAPAFPGRNGNNTYYRVAIATGKSIPFPQPGFAVGVWNDFGTDGGMHNFLRYLEDRGANNAIVYYTGSMINMFYSQYNTGIFKCCNSVYSPPTRNYMFDKTFQNPSFLPPGTPMFQDVVSLSYHQTFTPTNTQ